MQHYDVWIQNSYPALEAAFEQVQNAICRALLLCASIGCRCVMGKGEQHCSEVYHGKTLRVSVSEGPTWLTVVCLLRESLHMQIYLDDLPSLDQRVELERALRALGGTLYWTQDSKAITMGERLGR
jgi:hypothetical protein